jgi:hypothetical protein
MKPEEILHKQVCQYIRTQYPDVIFTSEPSGLRLPIGLAVKLKSLRSGSKLPDLWIIERRANYGALFIELKADGVFNKKGKWKTPHIEQQAETIRRLIEKGYYAHFCCGFNEAKMTIDNYLNS